jgi:uncharacterized protein YecT (DUF1311 family)
MDAAPVRPLVRRVSLTKDDEAALADPNLNKAVREHFERLQEMLDRHAAHIDELKAQLKERDDEIAELKGGPQSETTDSAGRLLINQRTQDQIAAIRARAREVHGNGGRPVPLPLGKAMATADAKAGAAMRAKHDASVQRLASVQQRFREHWGRQ